MRPSRTGVLLSVLALSALQPALADAVDLNLNGDAARATYVLEFGASGLQADFGWLHHEDDGDVVQAGLQVTDFVGRGSGPWSAGLGGRLYLFDSGDDEGSALGLGGHAVYRWKRLEVAGEAFFAPDAVAFGDAEEFLDLTLTVGFLVHQRGQIYVGVREVRADFEDTSSITIDDGAHAGLRIRF